MAVGPREPYSTISITHSSLAHFFVGALNSASAADLDPTLDRIRLVQRNAKRVCKVAWSFIATWVFLHWKKNLAKSKRWRKLALWRLHYRDCNDEPGTDWIFICLKCGFSFCAISLSEVRGKMSWAVGVTRKGLGRFPSRMLINEMKENILPISSIILENKKPSF